MEEKKETKKKENKKTELRLKTEFVNTTPPGEKKDMSQPMRDSYDPPAVEAAWYDWWQAQGFFTADNTDTTREKFVIVIPPPNVTGSLHMGHALTNSIQDALTRWHRMSGRNALWIPGTDHAGIATQVVVEKKLQKEKGITRHDLGREAFVEEVWKWKDQYGNRIKNQLKRLGSSLDWNREAFTMDNKLSRAVVEAFVRMYDMGLIYRGTRLVNWCSALKTAISDIEVVKKELKERTKMTVPGHGNKKYDFGVLVSFSYPVEGSDEKITVATTRIETMLGDTAVAVHPDDPRYKHLHGKFVLHPFTNRRIPIITDPILVNMEFGTGAVKVTPAHDPNDYDCGMRHKLEFINIFDDDGFVTAEGGPFQGMRRFDAREAVLAALKEKGLYVDMVNNEMVLPICSRTKDVIEPRLKPQWYVNCSQMASNAVKAVADGELQIIPDSHVIVWNRWLENCKDWCISRQLWWGHRIPAYLVYVDGQPDPDPENKDNWVVGRNYEEALEKAKAKHADVPVEKLKLHQDPDVLDTWFSSGLFPFSVFGWPDDTQDMKAFYPTSLLETGHDILFFWVARMVMMGMTLTGKLPFSQVFLHAMVRDAHGRKMSKSLGNVLDPIDVTEGISLEDMHKKLYEGNLDSSEIETAVAGQKKDFPNGISECGTDAMRFALCAYTSQGRDINLDINRVLSYRHFCNKIWNATKFALMNLGDNFVPNATHEATGKEGIMERWILSRLHHAAHVAHEGWNTYDLSAATNAIYSFWLYELCDVYLEAIKPLMRGGTEESRRGSQDTLYTCIDLGLKLLHPFMPFVTEELWQRIPKRPNEKVVSIMLATYPSPATHTQPWYDSKLEELVKLSQEIIRSGRSMRTDYGIKPAARVQYYLVLQPDELVATFQNDGYVDVIKTLAYAEQVTLLKKGDEVPAGCAVNIVNQHCDIHLLLKGMVDAAAEIKKLQKNLDKTQGQLDTLKKRMLAKEYETKVPESVRKANDERVVQLQQEIESTKQAIVKFQNL